MTIALTDREGPPAAIPLLLPIDELFVVVTDGVLLKAMPTRTREMGRRKRIEEKCKKVNKVKNLIQLISMI